MSDLIIKNAGLIVSGDLEEPVRSGDTIVIRDGHIAAIGDESSVDLDGIDRQIDANGATVIPGLIDSHVHPVIGDFTPRQRTLDFIQSYLHGGVTTMISAGEPHVPGRPKDREGTKALAILANRTFRNSPPSGVKVHAGSLLLEKGLAEEDFAELADAGIRLVGEIGISGINDIEEAERMTSWAHKYGMKVLMHVGGASIPGSSAIGADFVLAVKPDVASHVNGGPTAPSNEDVQRIIAESDAAIEVVQCGNVKALCYVVSMVQEANVLDRLIVGTDSPSGTGVIPLGVLRTISWIAALCGVDPPQAIASATGNTARLYGLNTGVIREGAEGDVVIVDAPRGSQAANAMEALSIGDTLAVAVAVIDGEVRVFGSRNTPPPKRSVQVPWLEAAGH
jgi:enamidase